MTDYSGLYEAIARHSLSLARVGGEHFNAVLYFPTSIGPVTRDDYGNFVGTAGTTLELNCCLRMARDPNTGSIEPRNGLNIERTYLVGDLGLEVSLTGYYNTFVRCDITQNGKTQQGKFFIVDHITTALEEEMSLGDVCGQTICGYWERVANEL